MSHTVKMTNKQLQVMKDALEWYSRFLSGQVDSFPPAFDDMLIKKGINKWNKEIQESLALFKR